ncbi:MAG: hypothetical protein Q9181_007085 [Wetmoreana brouardii]
MLEWPEDSSGEELEDERGVLAFGEGIDQYDDLTDDDAMYLSLEAADALAPTFNDQRHNFQPTKLNPPTLHQKSTAQQVGHAPLQDGLQDRHTFAHEEWYQPDPTTKRKALVSPDLPRKKPYDKSIDDAEDNEKAPTFQASSGTAVPDRSHAGRSVPDPAAVLQHDSVEVDITTFMKRGLPNTKREYYQMQAALGKPAGVLVVVTFDPDHFKYDFDDVLYNIPSSELIRQAVETDDGLFTLSINNGPCNYKGSDDSKDDGETVFLDMRIDVDVFGSKNTMIMNDITTTSKIDARGIVVVLIRCSTSRSKEKWPNLIRRCHDPANRSIHGHTLSDMKVLTSLFSHQQQEEPTTLIMAGTDSFTANIKSFHIFFSNLPSRDSLLAILKEGQPWTRFAIGHILKMTSYVRKGSTTDLSPEDVQILRLLLKLTTIAQYKNSLKYVGHSNNALAIRQSRQRNVFEVQPRLVENPSRQPLPEIQPVTNTSGDSLCSIERCGRVFISTGQMTKHLTDHALTVNGKMLCPTPNCDKAIAPYEHGDRSSMTRPLNRHYRLYTSHCSQCDDGCYTKQELNDHHRVRHGSEKQPSNAPDVA